MNPTLHWLILGLVLTPTLFFPGTSRPCLRFLAAFWRDNSLGLGVRAMALLTVGDTHVPWRSRFSLHLQCSGSWTQVWARSREGD